VEWEKEEFLKNNVHLEGPEKAHIDKMSLLFEQTITLVDQALNSVADQGEKTFLVL